MSSDDQAVLPMEFGFSARAGGPAALAADRSGWRHEVSATSASDEWLTPRELLGKLGEFDLDPCSPRIRPWPTAKKHLTCVDHGLISEWQGRAWVNPPYSQVGLWLDKAAEHGNAICLVFARTDTRWWVRHVWGQADGVFFFAHRLRFCRPDGTSADKEAGSPSALVCYGAANAEFVKGLAARAELDGCFVALRTGALAMAAAAR